jgi:hypothetical protein
MESSPVRDLDSKIELTQIIVDGTPAAVKCAEEGHLEDRLEEQDVKRASNAKISTRHLPYLARYMSSIIWRTLPDSMWVNTENLPKYFAHRFAFFNFLVYWSIVLYYAVDSYNAQIGGSSLSLDPNSGLCESNSRQLDLNLFVSSNNGSRGIWSTLPEYESSTTTYSFHFSGFSGNASYFENKLNNIENRLIRRAAVAASKGLAWNYVLWTTFIFQQVEVGHGKLFFWLTGDTSVIFDSEVQYSPSSA